VFWKIKFKVKIAIILGEGKERGGVDARGDWRWQGL